MKKVIAYAKIKNKGESDASAWTEDLEVESEKTAEKDVKEIVDGFNGSLRPGEREREFVSITKVETRTVLNHSDEEE